MRWGFGFRQQMEVHNMRKTIALLLACLLIALCFACGKAEEETVTTTQTTAVADTQTTAETTTEIATEPPTTTASPNTATKKPATQGPSVQEILDSGVYTLRGSTAQGPVVIVSDGSRLAIETAMDWEALLAQKEGNQAEQCISAFGGTVRTVYMPSDRFFPRSSDQTLP